MPQLPPHLASSSQYDVGDGAPGGGASGGGGGSGVHDVLVDSALEAGCAVNVLAMERLGDNLMSLSQVGVMWMVVCAWCDAARGQNSWFGSCPAFFF